MEIQTLGHMPPVMMDTRPPANLCPPESTLWMGDMNSEWNLDFIRAAFDHFGVAVKNVKFVTEKGTGRPASYCFVEFATEDEARCAILTTNGRHIPNDPERRRFHLSFANSQDPSQEFNLFVTNLHHSVDDIALFKVFGEKYRTCRGAKVYRNPDGSSKESGFIRFTSETDQQMALVEMNKVKVKGKEMVLRLARARTGLGRGPKSGGFGRDAGFMNNMAGPYDMGYGGVPTYSSGYSSRDRGYRRERRRSRSRSEEKVKPPKVFLEPVDPPSPRTHNAFLMDNEWDFQTAFDRARFSKILVTPDLQARDLGVELYEN